jgi:hypothetical protein
VNTPAFELPPGGRVCAVGTVGPDGRMVAVGIERQPGRERAVVEATVDTVGGGGAMSVLGGAVLLAPGARVSGFSGEALPREAIGAGARVWLGGSWSDATGFVADVIRLRARREFEMVKVAGPARFDPERGLVEIAGFTVVMNDRTLLVTDETGAGEDREDE